MITPVFFTITSQDFRESIARSRTEKNAVREQIRAIEQKTFAGRLPQARLGVTAPGFGAVPHLFSDTTPSAHSVNKANERNVSACESGDVNAREGGRIFRRSNPTGVEAGQLPEVKTSGSLAGSTLPAHTQSPDQCALRSAN